MATEDDDYVMEQRTVLLKHNAFANQERPVEQVGESSRLWPMLSRLPNCGGDCTTSGSPQDDRDRIDHRDARRSAHWRNRRP